MSRPPCEPLSPPWPTPAPLPVSVSLSWLLALRSSWSTHACNLKKLPSSPRFPPTVNLPPNLPKPNTLQNTLPLSTQTPLVSSAPTPCLQWRVSKALAASLPRPPPAELPTVPRIQDGGGGAYLGELRPAAARTGRPHTAHTLTPVALLIIPRPHNRHKHKCKNHTNK